MKQIKCPKCGEVFQVDASGYADIVKQVRDSEFNADVAQRQEMMQREKEQAVALEREKSKGQLQQSVSERDARIKELEQQLAAKEAAFKTEKDLIEERARAATQEDLTAKDARIAQLEQQLAAQEENAAAKQRLAVVEARTKAEKERDEFAAQVELQAAKAEQEKAALREQMATRLSQKDELIKYKDDELSRVKDMRARLSTKLLGETLEQHCETAFNSIRATAFPNAYFEKDNAVVEGTKGDYVFRESAEDGTELISIMFEMKNEQDASISVSTKHKNEDHFKKLDSDRNKKGCEYAVLVSMLEPDSELYNQGIVDVSYRYPKMFVIRPQFFIPLIGILRNASLNALEARKELALVRQQNIDVTNFESSLEEFKDKFGRNYDLASRKFQKAIEEIDKSIAALQKTKDNLLSSENNLRLANDKAQDLTVKKLTRKNETMKRLFEEARSASEGNGEEQS